MKILPADIFCEKTGAISSKISTDSEEINPKFRLLIHEMAHKAFHKLNWEKTKIQTFAKDASKDIAILRSDAWTHCHFFVKERLKNVSKLYSKQEIFEEYLVRVPEIAFKMADKTRLSSEEIDAILNRDIPNILRIYKEEFLPHLSRV